ncbi:unnamed protein product, partial [Iphiclides podalirius]
MEIASIVTFILLLEMARSEEVATPSSQLQPRNFNHHTYEAKLKSLMGPVPTRKGPVLFPNDVPPVDTPEIATSKPLYEPVAHQSGKLPTYFAPLTKYVPMVLGTLAPDTGKSTLSSGRNVIEDYAYNSAPYTDIVKKSVTGFDLDGYRTYEQSTSLPPIYNALSDHAERNLVSAQRNNPRYDYQPKKEIHHYDNNDVSDGGNNSENLEDKGYAFSYTVRDQKTGDDFSHSQRSSGSATNGEYRVRLPDGRTQIVSYTADENGYKADVRYDVDSVNSVDYGSDSSRHSPEQSSINQRYSPDRNSLNRGYEQNVFNQYNTKQPKQEYSKEYSNVPSKEYHDYSVEYDGSRTPYRSKFSELFSDKTGSGLDCSSTTPRPSYIELGDVLSKALPNVTPNFYNHPDSTDGVRLDGGANNALPDVRPNFYNYHDAEREGRGAGNTQSDNPLDSFVASTPRSYLVSTIASLRDRAAKPILSDSFISRINKYLSFK